MHPEHSLRSRFLWAMGSIVLLLVTAFVIALVQFVDVLEDELLARVVTIELNEMRTSPVQGPAVTSTKTGGLQRWTVSADDQRELPEPLRNMREGVREIQWVDGSEVFAGKLVVDGSVHAVVADIHEVERLERRLLGIGVAAVILAILLCVLLAAWLSRITLQPISSLVERLNNLDPTHPLPLLTPQLQTGEARSIATAVDEYQARIKRLLERERSLTDDISHELRTPTSVITTASELLLDDPTVAGVVRRRVERIARAARKTGTVVETLLFLGREESGDATVAVDVQDVVRETVEIFRPLAEAKGIELVAECTGQERIAAPPGTLAIVLQNLVENAVRFTEHGNVRVLYESGKLIVEDTGVGLGGVDANRIFERGYRSDASRGSGLGLDLTRRICERVGWQVSASPRSTGGTRFEVSLAGSIIV
jgi:signal transduction histidine kinase